MKCQFLSTTGVVCKYGTLTINTLTHLLHNHNLPKWVAFTKLVKAFNNYNHVIISILGKNGTPPRRKSKIKRMYDSSVVQIIIGRIKTATEFKVGVKKGDIMALLIFLLLIMDFLRQ